MPANDEGISALRAAVEAAPDNVSLRRLLADFLLERGFAAEAEGEFRAVLERAPGDQGARLGLARACHRQGRHAAALALVEEILAGGSPPPEAHSFHARLLVETGEGKDALAAAARALETGPAPAEAGGGAARGDGAEAGETGTGDAEAGEAGRRAAAPVADDAGDDAEEEDDVEAGPGRASGGTALAGGRRRVRAAAGSPGSTATQPERPMVDFEDVGGMEAVKEEIRVKIILPMAHPELYAAYGKKAGGGVLLYGPPGCGKTHIARATAGEVNAAFIAVGISDVLDMWIGESERKLHALFEQARSHAPCVLFFDEVDALGASRSELRGSAGRSLVNQFLAEMDGVQSDNSGVLVLAATNAPWHLDPAFRRPGRFDRMIFVPPPDTGAREAILRILLRGKPAERIDCAALAKATESFSGADLKGLVDLAVERKLQEAVKAGRLAPLGQKDLAGAVKSITPSTREWFATARNYVLFANQGGLYDPVREYLKL